VTDGGDERVDDDARLARHLLVRHAKRAVAGAGQRRIAAAVALEGEARSMVLPAVGLDDEAGVHEEEVDLKAGDRLVHKRLWQTAVAAQLEETLLEPASRERRARRVDAERRPELCGSAMPGVGSGEGIEGGDVRKPGGLGLIEEPLEAAALQRGREVEDRARRGGDRDAVVRRRLAVEVPGAVDANPRALAASPYRARSRRSWWRRWRAAPTARRRTRG
jgi:hypothetical protein